MTKANLYTNQGKLKSQVDLEVSCFNVEVDQSLLHLAVTVYRGNQRQGTSKTKSRSEVSGSGKKPWKQKGTGRARAGTNQSPIWVRGGKAHGAIPRSYVRKLNKKLAQKALKGALTFKASKEQVSVFEDLNLKDNKTKLLLSIFNETKIQGVKKYILIADENRNLRLAARNIPNLVVGNINEINIYDILNSEQIVFTQDALNYFAQHFLEKSSNEAA